MREGPLIFCLLKYVRENVVQFGERQNQYLKLNESLICQLQEA
jgi:hypothetical protein